MADRVPGTQNNEQRADLGEMAVRRAAVETNVVVVDPVQTAITDVLAYIAHFCDRCGLDPRAVFEAGLWRYDGDSEDGPPARPVIDPERPLV